MIGNPLNLESKDTNELIIKNRIQPRDIENRKEVDSGDRQEEGSN